MRKEELVVRKIVDDVKKNKDDAVIKYTKKFDCKTFSKKDIKVTEKEISDAIEMVETSFVTSFRKAIKNITAYHQKQHADQWFETLEDDVILGLRNIPLDIVGIYVPGGRACYPSSVLMNAIPAKVAGVKKIVMVTPCGKDKKVDPHVLFAANEMGITEIYKIGGAQAVAALAYGTKIVPKVDKIVGPGNTFVTLAKKQLYGEVGIDKLAGPSDVVIIADSTADVRFIASDMMAQAEHDPLSRSILISTSKEIERDVKFQIKKSKYLKNCKFIIAKDVDEAANISNKIAPEHLELMVDVPQSLLEKIKNAGAVFLGDYIAGPNHVLPTDGSARFASPLGVYDFIKKQSVIGYTKSALEKVKADIMNIATVEGLSQHARSVDIRFLPR